MGLRAPRDRPLAVLGNGPSLRNLDFANHLSGFDSIGMNAAYRYWSQIGWYPTYYTCLDLVVGMDHLDSIADLITSSPLNGIRRFFLRSNAVDALAGQGIPLHDVVNFDQLRHELPLLQKSPITTGSHSALIGAILGYEVMVLLGIDLNYVETVPGSEAVGENILRIVENRPNPNYFFEGYQQVGDRYQRPNPTPGLHGEAWRHTASRLVRAGVDIRNANPGSLRSLLPFCAFPEGGELLRTEARERYARAVVLGPHIGRFDREDAVSIREVDAVAEMLEPHVGGSGMLIDVGAHRGSTTQPFVDRGWRAVCFEPDRDNRQALVERFSEHRNVRIDARSVCNSSGGTVPFFISDESSGISTLLRFAADHRSAYEVETVTLLDALTEYGVTDVDVLKIDAEGADLIALRSFPWNRCKPRVVIMELSEDNDRRSGGGTTRDRILEMLSRRGYVCYLSVWHRVQRYGSRHSWSHLVRIGHGDETLGEAAWGNIVALSDEIGAVDIVGAFVRAVNGQRAARRMGDLKGWGGIGWIGRVNISRILAHAGTLSRGILRTAGIRPGGSRRR